LTAALSDVRSKMTWIETYILIWQLPVALLIASLAIVPIRNAYRELRNGDLDMLEHGAVEQAFMASLWVGIAAIVYPYALVLIMGVWICLSHRHIMTARAWLASLLALTLCGFWYFVKMSYWTKSMAYGVGSSFDNGSMYIVGCLTGSSL